MLSKKQARNFSERSSYYWEEDPIITIKSNPESKKKYTLVDLCCGAGGLSKGLTDTKKITSILGVDILTTALKTYSVNNPNSSTILGDIEKIHDSTYKKIIGDNTVDIVAAGVPCQGFSLANIKRDVKDKRNFLFLEVIRFVKLFNPKVVIIENVSGMRSLGKGKFESTISEAISSVGYKYTVKKKILNAADYGVPQMRKRLVFVGIRSDIKNEFKFPEPKYGTEQYPYRNIKDAISDLPYLNNNEEKNHYDKMPKTDYQRLMRINVGNKLYNHKSPRHPQSTIDRISRTKAGYPMYDKYKQRIRLSWNISSPTQLAGGIRPQFQFGHPNQARGLSVRERARIQSFPDDFIFTGGIVQGRVQTGNAVPPLLANVIGNNILKVLGEK